MKCVQVGESHVNGHRCNHAAAAETDGPGSPCLQRRFIATSGTNALVITGVAVKLMKETFPLSVKTEAGGMHHRQIRRCLLQASPYPGPGPGPGPGERLVQPVTPLETDTLASLSQVKRTQQLKCVSPSTLHRSSFECHISTLLTIEIAMSYIIRCCASMIVKDPLHTRTQAYKKYLICIWHDFCIKSWIL